MARTKVSTAHRFSSAMFHAAHAHAHATSIVCVHASCSCTARGVQLKHAFHTTHTPNTSHVTQANSYAAAVGTQEGVSHTRLNAALHNKQSSPAKSPRTAPQQQIKALCNKPMARIRGRHPNNKPSSTSKRNASGGGATCQLAHYHSHKIQCQPLGLRLTGMGVAATHVERFLGCVVEGAAHQVQLTRGAYVATNKRQRMRSSKPRQESLKTRSIRTLHTENRQKWRARSPSKKMKLGVQNVQTFTKFANFQVS